MEINTFRLVNFLCVTSLAMGMVVDSISSTPQHFSVRTSNHGRAMSTAPPRPDIKNIDSCSDGFSGDCLSYSVEDEEDGSNDDRPKRTISYEALKRNMVPCGQPGHSYYYCGISGQANPYRRGCSVITRCARFD
ncbi:protein RALF-like 33 [Rosa sericea]